MANTAHYLLVNDWVRPKTMPAMDHSLFIEEVKFSYKLREEKNLCYVLTFSRLSADEL